MLPGEKVYKISGSDPESQSPRWAGDEGAGLRGLSGGAGSRAGGSPWAARRVGRTGPAGGGFASRGVPGDGGFLLALLTSEPRSGLQKCLGAQGQPSPSRTALRRAAGPDQDSAFSLTSPLPAHTHPDDDEGNQRAAGNYYELFAAALGNLEWLRSCLSRGRDKIPADDKGFTAIHFAAQSGKLTCLQALVEEYKFPVDLPTKNGQTPLLLVIDGDNKSMTLPCIHYLLEQGAALNTQTCSGCTPLHLAACKGLLSCVKVLVQNGANVHARDALGCKPIDYCKIWNHRDCARYLKDAMWKRDKKDFAREMGKLKRLKDQLAFMEQDYLIEYQKEHQILREADCQKWLHRKQLPGGQSQTRNTKQAPYAPQLAITVSRTPKHQGPQKSFYPSPEARLWQTSVPKLQPSGIPTPTYMQPMLRRPKSWNVSNNPARSPTTQIGYPQGIRLGVHPDPSPEHDFHSFLEVRSDRYGGVQLHTVAGGRVAPVPQLPFEVVVQELHPSVRPHRLKVPQGFCPISMSTVPQKRHFSDDNFWTDTLAMNLRETFDEAFLAAVRAHQGLPTLPSPKSLP
ncbi:LOW QUALITY PROTEIN: ankyrin repeat domain-containing protein 53 [Meles meles]|uniref:LOW QUALITY PROTEIN: ankyrin repeat domain-containing protein 53 n=1 Tax=Meles meles TaxID=9662 RepID=UPI001E6992BE|nr:LOW QUALITY PROTEIN: ankyrin repeat domain-containing protein 53 [Meles meles]